MTPTYSMGLPLFLLIVAQVIGWDLAPTATMVIHALFGLWLVYRLGRKLGLQPGWAALGSALLAASPLYIEMSLQVMSDVPALVWVTAAMLGAWESRERPWLAFAAGIAYSIAVLDRPTNVLLLPPLGIALGIDRRRWLLLIAGGIPGAVFLGAINHLLYGQIFATGYGGFGWMFSPSYVPPTLWHYARWLPVLLTPLVLLALGLPWFWRSDRLRTSLLAVWIIILPAFYLFYSCTHETWWYLRFLLPAFPPLLVAALLVARALAARWRLALRSGWLAVAMVAVFTSGYTSFQLLGLRYFGPNERDYLQTTSWMQSHLPEDAVVATMQTSGALVYYTKFAFVRWDWISPSDFERVAAACASAGRPIYAALYPFEIEGQGAFQKHLAGHWTEVKEFGEISVWRHESPGANP